MFFNFVRGTQMKCKSAFTVAVFCVATCVAWNVQAQTLGQVGQYVSANGSGIGFAENSGLGSVTAVKSGSYSDGWGSTGSVANYDVKARAAAGEVGLYNSFSYTNGGDWYSSSASAYSNDVVSIFDASHANSSVGITFSASIHGGLSSWDSNPDNQGAQGQVYAEFDVAEFNSTTSTWNYPTQTSLFYDSTSYGITTYGARSPSFTYYLMLDSNGYGQLATRLSIGSYASEGVSKWSPSSGGVLAGYYHTVGITVGAQSASTTITSQGGWNVGSVSAVPEPETYAMLLVGLGLVSVVARRRQRQTV